MAHDCQAQDGRLPDRKDEPGAPDPAVAARQRAAMITAWQRALAAMRARRAAGARGPSDPDTAQEV